MHRIFPRKGNFDDCEIDQTLSVNNPPVTFIPIQGIEFAINSFSFSNFERIFVNVYFSIVLVYYKNVFCCSFVRYPKQQWNIKIRQAFFSFSFFFFFFYEETFDKLKTNDWSGITGVEVSKITVDRELQISACSNSRQTMIAMSSRLDRVDFLPGEAFIEIEFLIANGWGPDYQYTMNEALTHYQLEKFSYFGRIIVITLYACIHVRDCDDKIMISKYFVRSMYTTLPVYFIIRDTIRTPEPREPAIVRAFKIKFHILRSNWKSWLRLLLRDIASTVSSFDESTGN